MSKTLPAKTARNKTVEKEVKAVVNKTKNLPLDAVDREIKIDQKGAKQAFEKMKEIGGDVQEQVSEIIKLKEGVDDSFFRLYANLVIKILDAKKEEITTEERENFFKGLNGFSFLENEDNRSKDDDMEKALQTMQDLGKSSPNQTIQNILKSSLQETFSETAKLIDETQKDKTQKDENDEEKKENEEDEKDKKKSKKDDDLSNSLKKGGRAAMALAIALTAASPAGPIMIFVAIGFLYATRNFGDEKDKDEKSKQFSQEYPEYSEAWENFMTPALEKEQKDKKTNSEEVSEKLAEEAKKELKSVEESLEEERVKLQEQNKKVHQELLAQFKKPVEESEPEVKKQEEEKNVEQKNTEESTDFLEDIGGALDNKEIKKTLGGGSFENFDDTGQFSHNLGSNNSSNNKTSQQI